MSRHDIDAAWRPLLRRLARARPQDRESVLARLAPEERTRVASLLERGKPRRPGHAKKPPAQQRDETARASFTSPISARLNPDAGRRPLRMTALAQKTLADLAAATPPALPAPDSKRTAKQALARVQTQAFIEGGG